MNEKIYKTMGRVGGGNIAMGAVLVVVGVATGRSDDRKRGRPAETTREIMF